MESNSPTAVSSNAIEDNEFADDISQSVSLEEIFYYPTGESYPNEENIQSDID